MNAEDNAPVVPQSETPEISGPATYLIKERYEIKFDTPLPRFDSNGASAYEVKDKINPQRELFALICDNRFPPRLSFLPYLKSIDHPNILKLVEYGITDNPKDKSRSMALIYKRPEGPRADDLTASDSSAKLSMETFKSLILSLVSGCESLKGYNITHRAIRLDNIFFKDNSKTEFVLGDCVATFPALHQPNAYETIENLLAIPEGRGNGVNSDDMYAVGVAMLSFILQKELGKGLSAPELMRLKLKKGSFAALLDGNKLSSQFTGIIKALLEDNVENRWTYLQLYNFLEGKPGTFAQSEAGERSMRALTIDNEKIYSTKAAAIALLNHPEEGISLIKSGKLLEWIKNGLENEKLFNKVEKVARQNNEADGPNKFLIAQICTILDYNLPIKAGEIYLFPDGLPKTIYYYIKAGKNLNDFYGLLSSDVIKQWYQEQPSQRAPSNSGEFRMFINRKDYGYGIDRIMYDFDDDLPCTSPLVGDNFVNSPSRLLRALDSNYSTFKDTVPFDRNIIAYLRCKMGKKIDGILTDINSRSEALQNSAIIRLYANIQNKHGPVQVPNLTQWLVSIAKPIIKTYHNIKYQKYLEKELVKIAKFGKIIDVYEILENDEAKQKDRVEYSAALKEINRLNTERSRILNGGAKQEAESRDTALRLASMLAILTMLSSFVFNLIFWAIK